MVHLLNSDKLVLTGDILDASESGHLCMGVLKLRVGQVDMWWDIVTGARTCVALLAHHPLTHQPALLLLDAPAHYPPISFRSNPLPSHCALHELAGHVSPVVCSTRPCAI